MSAKRVSIVRSRLRRNPANATPKPPPKEWWKSLNAFWESIGRGGAAAILAAVLTPLLLMSETRLKESIENVFGGCVLVLEKRSGGDQNAIDVRGYLSGSPPAIINLIFKSGKKGKISKITFVNGILANASTPYSSLLLHPRAGQSCSGDLCPGEYLATESPVQMTIRLANPSPTFDYIFKTTLKDEEPGGSLDDRLIVYAIAAEGQRETCRVEAPNAFNILVRMDKLQRFVAYMCIVLVASIILLLFRAKGRDHVNSTES